MFDWRRRYIDVLSNFSLDMPGSNVLFYYLLIFEVTIFIKVFTYISIIIGIQIIIYKLKLKLFSQLTMHYII